MAGLGCGLLTLLWLVVAGAFLAFWLRGPAYAQCHEIVVAFPNRDAEEVDRQVGVILAGTDPSMVHRTVAEDGRLTVYARSDQVAAFVKETLGRPPLVDGGASIQAVGQIPGLPPAPVATVRTKLRVNLDMNRCRALGISGAELRRKLEAVLDRVGPDALETVKNIEVGSSNGSPVRLGDVAMVADANVPSHVVRNYPQDAPDSPTGGAGDR